MNNFARNTINEISSSNESLIPKFEWHGCMSKKRQPNLYNMVMFSLSKTILLIRMGT
jgi:hypothetical protein